MARYCYGGRGDTHQCFVPEKLHSQHICYDVKTCTDLFSFLFFFFFSRFTQFWRVALKGLNTTEDTSLHAITPAQVNILVRPHTV